MVYYELAGMGATFAGPSGVLLPLGVELVVKSLPQITAIYNYFSIFMLLILAIASSQRDTKFMSILIPVWAGFCMWAGWLHFVNQATGFGIIVVCCMIAIMTYMQETIHEKFGIAGPGNKIIKIFTFLIVLQCVVVFLNTGNIFPSDTQNIGVADNKYTNIDLSNELPKLNNAGGLQNSISDILTVGTQMAIASIRLFGECLLSIALFSVVLSQVFPWVVQAGAIGVAFLVVIQVAIWLMYLLFIFQTFYRPGPDPGW